MKNYYKILQVDENASLEVIKKVYKYLIKKNHPDLFSGKEKEEAIILVQNLNEAYEVLYDEEKRKNYDIELKEQKINNEYNLASIQRLEKENLFLQEKLIEKEDVIERILKELDIPYIPGYTQENNFKNNSQDIVKKEIEYMKEKMLRISFILIVFGILILLFINIKKMYLI